MNKLKLVLNSSQLQNQNEEPKVKLLSKIKAEIDEDGGMSENAFLHKITDFANEIHGDL